MTELSTTIRRWLWSRARIVDGLQLALGLGLLWWILRSVAWTDFVAAASMLSAGSIALVVVASLLGMLCQFLTWHAFASAVADYRPGRIAEAELVVRFLNSLLPSRISGRSAAPLVLRHYTGASLADAAAVTTLHTCAYAVLYGLVTILAVVPLAGRLPREILLLVTLAGGAYLAVGGFLLLAGFLPEPILGIANRVGDAGSALPVLGDAVARLFDAVDRTVRTTTEQFRALATRDRSLVAFAIGWFGTPLLFPAVRFWILLSALGHQFEPVTALPLVLLAAYSVTVLPVTPAGVGVTEATAVAVFVALGVPNGVAVPAVLLDRVLGVYLPALAGWYPLATADVDWSLPDDWRGL